MSAVPLLERWSPPEGAGAPIACLATTFTFESDFFTEDCLARFLCLSTVRGEGDRISTLAAVLEEEDRLSETQVTVLADRSTDAEKRNMRWDLVPVHTPGGLLHAKTVVLIWEHHARLVLGSANLTSAGYRRQVELALAIDLGSNLKVPRAFLDDFVAELRLLVDLAPGPRTRAPSARAHGTLDLLERRIEALDPPMGSSSDLRIVLAPARPGLSPFAKLKDAWRGARPLRASVLSPFWDSTVPAPAILAIRAQLTGLPAASRSLTLIAGINPFNGAIQGPETLVTANANLVQFDPPDDERRTLHAKLTLIESEDWLAALIGSSNSTQFGLGLHPTRGHHELNVWLGCPASSRHAKHLKKLARPGKRLDLDGIEWEPDIDEDGEPVAPQLPLGFADCLIHSGPTPRVQLIFDRSQLPGIWDVRDPAGRRLTTSVLWRTAGSKSEIYVDLLDSSLPAYLVVTWEDEGSTCEATWTANVADRSTLPPPAGLAELSAEVLLAALASSRPLPIALENELRRRERQSSDGKKVDLDPLHRFDGSGLLLHRSRMHSLAFQRLQERLSRPTGSVDAVRWRLAGPLGPLAIAKSLVAASPSIAIPGEGHFIIAELALTVGNVDWPSATPGIDRVTVRQLVIDVLTQLKELSQQLPTCPDPALGQYVVDALEAARK